MKWSPGLVKSCFGVLFCGVLRNHHYGYKLYSLCGRINGHLHRLAMTVGSDSEQVGHGGRIVQNTTTEYDFFMCVVEEDNKECYVVSVSRPSGGPYSGDLL